MEISAAGNLLLKIYSIQNNAFPLNWCYFQMNQTRGFAGIFSEIFRTRCECLQITKSVQNSKAIALKFSTIIDNLSKLKQKKTYRWNKKRTEHLAQKHCFSLSEYALQQNDAVVDNDLHIVCDGTITDTTVVPQNGIDSNACNQFETTENAISITKTETIDDSNICYSPSWSLPVGDSDERYDRIEDVNHECDVSSPRLPTSLKFNRNTMSISVKHTNTNDERFAQRLEPTLSMSNPSSVFNEMNENVICSPNFGAIELDGANQSIESEPNAAQNLFEPLNFNVNRRTRYHSGDNNDDDVHDVLKAKEPTNDRLMELLRYKDPLRSAVVLRSPRGNQPRTYTTDALYSALMDVKSGESIYR